MKKAFPLFLLILGSLAAAYVAFVAFGVEAHASPNRTAAQKRRLTRSEIRTQLQASAQTQLIIQSVLVQLQKLKASHISKSKLAAPNDRHIAAVYDRLIAVVDARYKSGDLADFIASQSLKMAETEKLNNSNLAIFFTHLGDVVRAAQNDRVDIIATIENYIRSAPVATPLTAARFILNQSYSNGSAYESASGLSREDAAPDEPMPPPPAQEVEASILPQIEIPQMLPPSLNVEEEVTVDTTDKTSELVPEKTPEPETTMPSTDSSAPNESPVVSSPTASLPFGYSDSVSKSRRE